MSGVGEQDVGVSEKLYAYNRDSGQHSTAASMRGTASSHRPRHQHTWHELGKENQKELCRPMRYRPTQEEENTGKL